MSFHTVAFTITTSLGTAYTAIPAVLDTIMPPSGNGVLPPTDLWLVAAFAGSATIQRARVTAPSLLRVGSPSIRPLQAATLGAPQPDPNFATFINRPVRLRSSEAVGVEGACQAGGETAVAFLWIADQLDPIPSGEIFSLRFTSATALTGVFGWSMFAPVYDQAVPSGVYAVVGLEFASTTAYAARVVFPGSVFRPGVLAQRGGATLATAGSTRTAACFYDYSLGTWGIFQTNAPPNIEVFSQTTDAAASIEGYLSVIRLGDIGTPVSSGSGPSGMGGTNAGFSSPGVNRGPATLGTSSLLPHVSVSAGYGPGTK